MSETMNAIMDKARESGVTIESSAVFLPVTQNQLDEHENIRGIIEYGIFHGFSRGGSWQRETRPEPTRFQRLGIMLIRRLRLLQGACERIFGIDVEDEDEHEWGR